MRREQPMYADTVQSENVLKKPLVFGGIALVCAIVAFLLGSAALISTLLPTADVASIPLQLSASALIGVAFAANLLGISLLPNGVQRLVVYGQFLFLLIAFVLVFDLDMAFIAEKGPTLLIEGLTTTLYISAISISIAIVIALSAAIAKLSSNEFARGIATFYTSLFRGLPLLMQLYLVYLGLPQLGFFPEAIPAGIAALSLCYGAYMTEVFRAGILSISRGQWEASRALGFGSGQVMRRIILPQALPVVIPPTGNMFIGMLKGSSLVSVIGVTDLMFLARNLGSSTFNHMEMLLTAAFIYWALIMTLELIQSRLERHFNKSKTR